MKEQKARLDAGPFIIWGTMISPSGSSKTSPCAEVRFGLCCIFREEPIRFRTTTAKTLSKFSRSEQLNRISELCLHNTRSICQALHTCETLGIGAFRVLSPLFPRFTHPDVGYTLDELPLADEIRSCLHEANEFRQQKGMRLSFHPDQFVVLASRREEVVQRSVLELEYQGEVAEYIGAEVINLHVGSAQGGKEEALRRFADNFQRLSPRVRTRLTLENDDVNYSPKDLLLLSQDLGIPLVYDLHHHRCLPDGLTVREATRLCAETWERAGREPWFHISSPKNGWGGGDPRPHAEFIDPTDFPPEWRCMRMTVDVEAKAKELAVVKLMSDLGRLSERAIPK